MQDLSFSFPTPHFCFGGFEFSVMIYTFRNVYAPDEKKMHITENESGIMAVGNGFRWAGGQMETDGMVEIKACVCDNGIRIKATAEIRNEGEDIRCIKITIHGLPEGKLVNLINALPREIPKEGLNLKYPEGWRDVGTPLVIMETDRKELLISVLWIIWSGTKDLCLYAPGRILTLNLFLKRRQFK